MTQYKKNGHAVSADHQPLLDLDPDEKAKSSVLRISFQTMRYFSSLVMLVGFVLSIILAIIFRFKETTYTHCRVPNYIPSISAAIGTTPSAYVWRLSMCLVSLERLLFILFRYYFYLQLPLQRPSAWYRWMCHTCFIAEWLENTALIGLSCISSNDNFDIHEVLFVSFQVSAMVHMLFMCIVYKLATNDQNTQGSKLPIVKKQHSTFRRKVLLFLLNMMAFFTSLYFFFRHQDRCEAGMYSLFALFEYLVVITNIKFHADAYLDFPNRYIVYGAGRIHKE